jgi:uncharacterized membrane protein
MSQVSSGNPSDKRHPSLFRLPPALILDSTISVVLFGLSFVYRRFWNVGVGWGDPPDVGQYIASGNQLFEGHVLHNSAVMPLYPIFIHLFGHERVIGAQYVAAACSAVILYWLGRRLFASRTIGVITAVLFIVSPSLIFWSNLRLTETLYIFALLVSVLLAVLGRYILFAVTVTLATLIRPSVDLIAPVLIVLPFLLQRNWRMAKRAVVTFAIVYPTLMAPWWVHNYVRYGQFVRLDLGDGPTILLENNPQFEVTGLDFSKMFTALDPYYKMGNEVQVDHAMEVAALEYTLTNKLDFYRNTLDRVKRFFTVFPDIRPDIDAVFAVYLTVVYLFAFMFLVSMTWADVVKLAPVLLVVAFITTLHVLTHSLWRYRAPVEPFLYLLASAGMVRAAGVARRLPGSMRAAFRS